MSRQTRRRKGEAGSAMVEVALLSPWIFFLFVGVFDMGFYAYAAICTQNAARAAALAAAQTATSAVTPCSAALGELRMLPNVASGVGITCMATPVFVTVTTLTTTAADYALNNASTSLQATVTYTSVPLIPIPGVLMGQLNLTRIAEVRTITP